jgi:8-oxo-dGTP pyrophosphatase MutT (NUDIX family)
MRGTPTMNAVSSGGVAYRELAGVIEVALISVGPDERWQLPKGTVDKDEPHESAALREVREEAGIEAEIIAPLDTVEYWFYANHHGRPVRFHKFVHFFLMRFISGDVSNHDYEVNEARWVEIGEAIELLAFKNEQDIVRKAQDLLQMKD